MDTILDGIFKGGYTFRASLGMSPKEEQHKI